MANPEHLNRLGQGVQAWNAWRRMEDPLPDLRNADLTGWDLQEFNLTRAVMVGVDLSHANLRRAIMIEADLRETNGWFALLDEAQLGGARLAGASLAGTGLVDANLQAADLQRTDLSGTDFRRSDLRSCNFWEAEFAGSHLGEASVGWTLFGNVDLSTAKGLETVKHCGPSTIGIDTLTRSRGTIPEAFLRGCGVPEQLIEYARSLSGQQIEFYSCFISYSTGDQAFAERIYSDLQDRGIRCWFAPHDIRGGKKLHDQIDDAIRAYDRLLLILSEHSMSSEWVKTEIAYARQKEITEGRQVLFPISLVPFANIRDWKCFDANTGKDSAREIREYFIPDFSNWRDLDSHQKAFDRLVHDLKAGKTLAESSDLHSSSGSLNAASADPMCQNDT
jgi:TIR domain/Pentapeptide repeats (8 copies)